MVAINAPQRTAGMESVFTDLKTKLMITKEKIIEILHSHSYNVEDQAGNHLIVVDDDSWDAVATEVKNCSIPTVVGQSEQLPERLCKNNPNFVCNCIDQNRCPNFSPY